MPDSAKAGAARAVAQALVRLPSLPSAKQLRQMKGEACKKFKAGEFLKNADIAGFVSGAKIPAARRGGCFRSSRPSTSARFPGCRWLQ